MNSMWEIQREPYKGDVINSYNDGPPETGKAPLGRSSSSGLTGARPGSRATVHTRSPHVPFRRSGGRLDRLARATIKVGLDDLTQTFPTSTAR